MRLGGVGSSVVGCFVVFVVLFGGLLVGCFLFCAVVVLMLFFGCCRVLLVVWGL